MEMLFIAAGLMMGLAAIGAAIGTAAGPLGVIMGGTIGTFVGAISVGITGGFLGHRFGKKAGVIVDQNIFLDFQCLKCKHRFKEKVETTKQLEVTLNQLQKSAAHSSTFLITSFYFAVLLAEVITGSCAAKYSASAGCFSICFGSAKLRLCTISVAAILDHEHPKLNRLNPISIHLFIFTFPQSLIFTAVRCAQYICLHKKCCVNRDRKLCF